MKRKSNSFRSFGRGLLRLLQYACIFCMIFSVAYLGMLGYTDYKSEADIRKLRESIARQRSERISQSYEDYEESLDGENGLQDSDIQVIIDKNYVNQNILPEFKEIHGYNPSFCGWLEIEGTHISYPVMQGPDNSFYLSHNMDKEYDKSGLLLLDTRCSLSPTDGFVIYGHNVEGGRMFGELIDYREKAYYQYHPNIQWDSLYRQMDYQIVYVTVMNEEKLESLLQAFAKKGFSEEEFAEFQKEMKAASLYDTGVSAQRQDEWLAIATCEYTQKNGRFVIVAKKN